MPGSRRDTRQARRQREGPNETIEVAFETRNLATGKVALGGGMAYVVKKSSARL
jgi:peroxisomal enoyl-CoA hydratase 2